MKWRTIGKEDNATNTDVTWQLQNLQGEYGVRMENSAV